MVSGAQDTLTRLVSTYVDTYHSKPTVNDLSRWLQHSPSEEVYHVLKTVRDADKSTAIHIATFRDHPDVLTLFLESVTPVEKYQLLSMSNDKGFAPLHVAVSQNSTKTVGRIMDLATPELRYQQLKMPVATTGDTSIHEASRRAYSNFVTTMLHSVTPRQRFELIKTQNDSGNTIVHLAAQNSLSNLIKSILKLLTPAQQLQVIDLKNSSNRTASDEALKFKSLSVVKLLIEYKRSIENDDEITPASGA